MRYPQHLILDLSTPTVSKNQVNWSYEYFKQLTPKHASLVSQLTNTEHSFSLLTVKSKVILPERSFYNTNLFDINFLRKDKIYTKLKYSRCPQYDIVSGGWAALFAGLAGFLISEKFGIELVDSGDFYTAFMYAVFLFFSTRPLIKILGKNSTPVSLLFLKDFFLFFSQLFLIGFRVVIWFISSITGIYRRF